MSTTNSRASEVTSLGRKIYAERIKHQVEPQHIGEYIIIDVESGDYEIGTDDMAAWKRLQARRPHAVGFANMIGYTTLGRAGGSMKRTQE